VRPLSPELRALVGTQAGLVTRQQLVQGGLTNRQVDRLGAPDGRGQRVLPRVYALTTGPLTRRQQLVAALLYCGPHAQLGGTTALELRGFRYVPPDQRVHVLLPMDRRVRSVGLVVVRRAWEPPAPHTVDGLPAVPVPRAAVDACRQLTSVHDATAVLAEAVQRRLCTVGMLESELSHGSSAGSAVARTAVQRLASGSASAPEATLLALVATSPLVPSPRVNERLLLPVGYVIPDLCWPQARLVVEVDSVEHHGLGRGPEQTARRRAHLTAAGWTVLSISPERIRTDPVGVLRDIEAAYLLGLQRTAG
jgi:very-short-patch-repair endonuclease